jgi:FkbM family methyltransferase
MLRRWVGYKGLIISFEPNPAVIDELRHRARNDPQWIVQQLALTSKSGTISFNVTEDTQFASIETPKQDEASVLKEHTRLNRIIEVECQTLDEVYAKLSAEHRFSRPVLKMDTQGHDLEVFKSGQTVIPQFVALQSEMSFAPFYEDVPLYEETFSSFSAAGFVLSAIFQNNRGSFPILREMDCVFVNQARI